MAYTKRDWDMVKAFFESGLSLREITSREEVAIKDKGTISRKAKQEGWIKGKIQPLVEKSIQVKQSLAEISEEKATLNATQKEVHDTLVYEKSKWLDYLNKAALKNVQESMTARCENQHDYRSRAQTIGIAKEVLVGKNPDVAVQVNTQVTSETTKSEFEEIALRLLNR